MKEGLSAAEALANKQYKRGRRRKVLAGTAAVTAAALAVVAVMTIKRIRSNDALLLAQNVISQFDINTTYREQELAPDGDNDGDDVINDTEKHNGTNPLDEDCDNDALSDGDEEKLGTDPKNKDTDGDGLLDGYELVVGLDPTAASTDGSQNDGSVVVEHTKKSGELTLDMKGSANIVDASIYEMRIFNISSNTGVVSKAYDIMSDYNFDSAKVTFKVNKKALENRGISMKNLSVLKFNKSNLTYEKLDTKADSASGTVTANIKTYGTYLVGVEKQANKAPDTRIAFLLDNSGSMYPYEVSNFPAENDVDFKRLDFTEKLIKKIEGDGDFLYSIAKFTADYSLMTDFTKDNRKLHDALDDIRHSDEVFSGSHIETALETCMDSFARNGNTRNIIVLLSDGASDEKDAKSVEELAKIAFEKNIIVMTVGLGREADRNWLQNLSAHTGGRYYSASDADALEGVYKQIVTTLNYDVVEYDSTDDSAKGYSLYNTGFDPLKNGYSFKNFRASDTPSLDFGMALFARDWYVGRLSMSKSKFSPSDESSQKYDAPGYKLKGSSIEEKFTSHEPLSSIVPNMLTSDLADVKKYLDFNSKSSTIKVKSSYAGRAADEGWVSQRYKLNASNLKWEKVELLSLDISGSIDKIAKASSEEEAEFYRALYTLNAIQWDDSFAEFDLYDGDSGFENLKELLARGEPVITTIDGSHTVNAIGLIQDSEDHRKFVLQVYDSNYPGAVKQVYITRSVKGEFDISGKNAKCKEVGYEYTCEYEGKQVGIMFSDVAV
ncbi:MAG: VWA domain-containing protein [Ruminococcus sp.]|nr:VWA domain-containing protein [Ruminococcus sp.]